MTGNAHRTIGACLALACQPFARTSPSGEMTHTEQIQLPPTAKAHIELTAPRFDAEPTVKLFSQDIAAPGSPIPFSVVAWQGFAEGQQLSIRGYGKDGERYLFGTGKVDVLRDDLGKPLHVELHYAPPIKLMFKCGPDTSDWWEVAFDLNETTRQHQ